MKNIVSIDFSGYYIIFQALWLKIILTCIQQHFYISKRSTELPRIFLQGYRIFKVVISKYLIPDHMFLWEAMGGMMQKGHEIEFFNPPKPWGIEGIP